MTSRHEVSMTVTPEPLSHGPGVDAPAGHSRLAGLVQAHADFVYAAALRQVRDPHLAADVIQAVFLILQQKLSALGPDTIMTAWLLRATRYTCLAALHRERRRKHHEHKAAAMRTENQAAILPDEWPPIIDAALLRLSTPDRAALAGVYFEGLTHRQVAQKLGVSEATAHKRVQRAVARLRKILGGRGKRECSVAAVVAALGALAAPTAAPAAVVAGVTATISGHAPAAILALSKGAMLMVKVLQIKAIAMTLAVSAAVVVGGAIAYQKAFATQPPARPTRAAALAATASSPADIGAKDPLQAALLFNHALATNDATSAAALLDASNEQANQVLSDWRDLQIGMQKIRTALLARFEEKPVSTLLQFVQRQLAHDASPGTITPQLFDGSDSANSVLKQAKATITGDSATISSVSLPQPVALVQRHGVWKIEIGGLLKAANGGPQDLAAYHADTAKKATAADAIAKDIDAGKFKTLEEAQTRILVDFGFQVARPELPPLQKRYADIFSRFALRRDLEGQMDIFRRTQEAAIATAKAVVNADIARGDKPAAARDALVLQDLQAKLDPELEARSNAGYWLLGKQVEAAVIQVRTKHGLTSDFPPGTPPFPDYADTPGVLGIIHKRMVFDLDDAMEKEVIDLLNDNYAKEKADTAIPATLPDRTLAP